MRRDLIEAQFKMLGIGRTMVRDYTNRHPEEQGDIFPIAGVLEQYRQLTSSRANVSSGFSLTC